MASPYNDQKSDVRAEYSRGTPPRELSEMFAIPLRTLYHWIKSENWQQFRTANTIDMLNARFQTLITRENKTDVDFLEMDRIAGYITAIERKNNRKNNAPDEPSAPEKPPEKKRLKTNNDFSDITEDDIRDKFFDGLFEYQKQTWETRNERRRFFLKSRQIGYTYYFAREAFAKALLTAKNQIFLSASRKQSDNFRLYIGAFAQTWFEKTLKGKDVITVQTPSGSASFYFLSTNSATAQSYHGDVYIDEAFWIPKFSTLRKLAQAMASQKQYTFTIFSTPSSTDHEAYALWAGEEFNNRNKRAGKPLISFPSFNELRADFVRCPDGYVRRIFTLDDAERLGCTLFNRADLELEYTPEEFDLLFNCRFADLSNAVFSFADLQKCTVDSSSWHDIHPASARPYAGNPVWIGYDPARSRDGACIVVVAPPKTPGGLFRIIEKIVLHNAPWEDQADTIRELTRKYNVEYIGIDKTGPGVGVFESVQKFFPAADGIVYTVESKTRLVLKMQQLVKARRIAWDINYSDIASGFLHIRRFETKSGLISYDAARSAATGHADAAMAIMHAVKKEGLIVEGSPGVTIAFSA